MTTVSLILPEDVPGPNVAQFAWLSALEQMHSPELATALARAKLDSETWAAIKSTWWKRMQNDSELATRIGKLVEAYREQGAK